MKEDLFNLGIKALIRNKKGEILLLKVNPEKLKRTEDVDYWDIPGGRIEKGVSVEETLKREIEEEISVTEVSEIKKVDMVLSNIRIPTSENESVGLILAIYSCIIPENSEIIISEEHIAYGWFNPTEAAKLLEVKYPEEFTKKVSVL